MFGRISNRFFDLINRTKPPYDDQQSANFINDQLNDLSLQPENNVKLDTDKNGAHNGENSEERENEENSQDEKTESNQDMNLIQHENEGRVENEKEFEIVGEGKQERNKKTRSLVRPEAQDCSSCLETGFSEFGMNGKVNHPPNRKPQVGKVKGQVESLDSATQEGKEKDDSKAEQTDCEVGKVNGKEESLDSATQKGKENDDSKAEQTDCESSDHRREGKSGKGCKFSHGRKTTATVELNFMGLPIRPGEGDCPYYMRHGSCKYEVNCKFNHPDPTSVGGSNNQLELSNEGPTVSPCASQSTPGSWSSAALNESPPCVPFSFPSTQAVSCHPEWRVPYHPEWHAYQAPVYPPERSMQLASGYAANSQPLERPVFTPHQQQIFSNSQPLERPVFTPQQQQLFVDEFPERPGQPKCNYFLKTGNCKYRSACKFHHPKNECVKSTSSALSDSCLPLRPAVQPLIQEPLASPNNDASFTKKSVGQNLVSNVRESTLKQPKGIPKKRSASQNMRCEVCNIACTSAQLYKEHLSGKKHTSNLQKLHASKITSAAAQASQSINKSCSAGDMGAPSGKGIAKVISLVSDLETMKQKSCSDSEMGTPSGKGRSGVTSLVTDLEAKKQKTCFADKMATPSEEGMAAVTTVVTDLETKKQKSCNANKMGNPSGRVTSAVTDLETKKKKLLETGVAGQFLRVCTICNVVCNGEIAFAEHMAGKRHLAQSCSASEIGTPSGKATAGVTSVVTDLEAKKQESCCAGEMGSSSGKGRRGVISVVTDLETKKQKLLEGSFPVQSLSVSTLCNVVCNGEIAFAEHMAGQKHLAQKSCITSEMGTPSGKAMAGVTTVVTDLEAKKQMSCNAGEMGTASGKGMGGVTSVVADLETKKQKLLESGIAVQSLRVCTICNVVCNGEIAFAEHIGGKKHLAQKSCSAGETDTPSGKGTAGVASVVTDSETKELVEGSSAVQSPRACTICNVPCNGEIASRELVAWKKHLAQERAVGNMADPNPTSGANPKPKSDKKTTEKTNAGGSACCEVCKIRCTSFEDLNHHKEGKKHKTNMEKLQKPKTDPTTLAPLAAWQPAAQSEEPEEPEDLEAKKQKNPEPKDLDAKKQKVLERGAAPDAVRTCTICNVVCNSETVFNSHLGGQKHAAMVKRKLEEAGNGS